MLTNDANLNFYGDFCLSSWLWLYFQMFCFGCIKQLMSYTHIIFIFFVSPWIVRHFNSLIFFWHTVSSLSNCPLLNSNIFSHYIILSMGICFLIIYLCPQPHLIHKSPKTTKYWCRFFIYYICVCVVTTLISVILSTSKLPVWYIDNIVMFYERWFWRMLYIYYVIIVIEFC